MIPANAIHPGAYSDLVEYLLTEVARVRGERRSLESIWIRHHESYRAHPESETKTFPFPGASNLVIPLIATDLDIIYARVMAQLFGPDALWAARPLRPDMVDFAARLQEFLLNMQRTELELEDPICDFLLELFKLGTSVLKTRYERQMQKVFEWREAQNPFTQYGSQGAMPGLGGMATAGMTPQVLERHVRMLIKDRPRVQHVSLWDFFIPADARNIKLAPWCAERIHLTWPQLVNRVREGIYTNLHQVGGWWSRDRAPLVERARQEMDRFVPSQAERFSPYEFWLDFDIDRDGEPEALVCTIHEESRAVLRVDYNPFFNQEKPYDFARYQRQEGRFYGIGLCEMLSPFQDEVTAMHNQRLDAGTVANAPIYVALKNGNIRQDEPIFPGRILLVDQHDEVKPFYNTANPGITIPNEQMTLQYSQKRSGVNDYVAGGFDGATPYSTATLATMMDRAGDTRFGQVMREVRWCMSGVGTKVVELYQQFNQGRKPFLAMGEQEGQVVLQILNFPMDIIRSGVAIDVAALDPSSSKQERLRENIMTMQMLTQYYMQLLQAVQLAINPQIPPQIRMVAYNAAHGGTTLLRRILDTQGTQDVDELVPKIEAILNVGQQQLGAIEGAYYGGAPVGQGPSGASGFPALQAGPNGAMGAGAQGFGF